MGAANRLVGGPSPSGSLKSRGPQARHGIALLFLRCCSKKLFALGDSSASELSGTKREVEGAQHQSVCPGTKPEVGPCPQSPQACRLGHAPPRPASGL